MRSINERKGISLVALIITIIVLIILTGAVIITMNQGNIIEKSKEAVFKHDVATYRDELVRIKMKEQLKRETGETTTLNLSPGESDLAAKKNILSSFKDEYNDILVIENGELKGKMNLLTSSDEQDEIYTTWLNELSIPIAWNNEQAGNFTITAEGVLTGYVGSDAEVIVPNTVTRIDDQAFSGCDSIESIMIPYGVTSIGNEAFCSCYGLRNITIPNSVISIGEGAFVDCSSLQNITIPNSVISIGEYAFNYSSIANITLSNRLASIGQELFLYCVNLQNIAIPNSVISIGDSAFGVCSSLQNITIPNSVISIGNLAFGDCSSLQNITIPNSVTSIGNLAFINCSNASFKVGSEGVKTLILNSQSGIAVEKITVDPSVN